MTGEGAVEVVTRLFAAAHWTIGDSDYQTYHEALSDLSDEAGLVAVQELVANVDLANEVRPSPALIRDMANVQRRRQEANRPALPEDTSPPASPETRAEWMAKIKADLAKAKGPMAGDLRRTVVTPNQPDFES